MNNCKPQNNLTDSCGYNLGGISNIKVLDISDFQSLKFAGDGLSSSLFVETIYHTGEWFDVQSSDESVFNERKETGYKQELETHINRFDNVITRDLLFTSSARFLVAFRVNTGEWKLFGHDGGGAKVSYSGSSGNVEDGVGYNLKISHNSHSPIMTLSVEYFEDRFNQVEHVYKPVFDSFVCDLDNNEQNGFKVAAYALKVSVSDETLKLDKNNYPIEKSGEKQAILVLANEENPNPNLYDVEGSYMSTDVLKGGFIVRVRDVEACKPTLTGTISVKPEKVQLYTGKERVRVDLVTDHPYSLEVETDVADVNYREGSGGKYSINVDRTKVYGNGSVTYKNLYSLETATIEIESLFLAFLDETKSNTLVVDESGQKDIKKRILCYGGSSKFDVVSNSEWLSVEKASGEISITVDPVEDKQDRKAKILIVHADEKNEFATIEVVQEFSGVIDLPPSDYLYFEIEYDSDSGKGLDVYSSNDVDALKVGATTFSTIPIGSKFDTAIVSRYYEQLVDGVALRRSFFFNLRNIKIDSILRELKEFQRIGVFGNWFVDRFNGITRLRVRAFYGGDMVAMQENNTFMNVGGQEVFRRDITRNVRAASSSNINNPTTLYTKYNSFEFPTLKEFDIPCQFVGDDFTFLNARGVLVNRVVLRNIGKLYYKHEGESFKEIAIGDDGKVNFEIQPNKLVSFRADRTTTDDVAYVTFSGLSRL